MPNDVNGRVPICSIAADPDRLWTFNQGCDFLHASRRKVWGMVDSGELPHVRIGTHIRFRRSTLVAWIEAQERKGTGD